MKQPPSTRGVPKITRTFFSDYKNLKKFFGHKKSTSRKGSAFFVLDYRETPDNANLFL